MLNEERLKNKIDELGLTIKGISKRMGISVSTFQRKVKADSFYVSEADILSDILGLTAQEVSAIFFAKSVAKKQQN